MHYKEKRSLLLFDMDAIALQAKAGGSYGLWIVDECKFLQVGRCRLALLTGQLGAGIKNPDPCITRVDSLIER